MILTKKARLSHGGGGGESRAQGTRYFLEHCAVSSSRLVSCHLPGNVRNVAVVCYFSSLHGVIVRIPPPRIAEQGHDRSQDGFLCAA